MFLFKSVSLAFLFFQNKNCPKHRDHPGVGVLSALAQLILNILAKFDMFVVEQNKYKNDFFLLNNYVIYTLPVESLMMLNQ